MICMPSILSITGGRTYLEFLQVVQRTATEKKGSKVLPVETIQSLLYKNLPRADSLNKSD